MVAAADELCTLLSRGDIEFSLWKTRLIWKPNERGDSSTIRKRRRGRSTVASPNFLHWTLSED